MKVRAVLAEVVVRLALLCAAGALLRWASVALMDWREEINATLERTWGGWVEWIGLTVAAGFALGLATLTGKPRGYRLLFPLVFAPLPALMLAHYVVLVENATPLGRDLPWILDHVMFYMDPSGQSVLAVVVGLGIALGLQPKARVEEHAPQS